MRYPLLITILSGLLAAPTSGLAQPASRPAALAASRSSRGLTAEPADHVITGTVRALRRRMLVLLPAGKRKPLMTFVLSRSLHQEGTVTVGATVSVRYRNEGASHVALAITVERAREPSTAVGGEPG